MITFVTSNANKLREAEAILHTQLDRVSLELDEIQSMDLREIVEHKAHQAYEQVKRPVIVEDAGLYLKAWNGFPGPFVKWLADTMGHEKLTKALPADNRQAEWIVLVAYCDAHGVRIFEGKITGTIATEMRHGDDKTAWGFDPIFIPESQDQTYAEMGPVKKLQYSARQRAFLVLKDGLSLMV